MNLDEFFNYKNKVMEDLITNEKIVELVDDEGKFRDNPAGLLYNRIYPFEYVPETVENGKTFICCDVDIQSVMNKTFLEPYLYIWVFSYKSKLRLPEGGVRVDKICSEISKVLNGSRYYGLGELDLVAAKRFAPEEGYLGKVLMFQTQEFNRTSPTGKSIPSNRRGR